MLFNRFLTQQEVEDLEPGSLIYVKWSGGNGPHLYKLATEEERYNEFSAMLPLA
jgi:hypothetical protein